MDARKSLASFIFVLYTIGYWKLRHGRRPLLPLIYEGSLRHVYDGILESSPV